METAIQENALVKAAQSGDHGAFRTLVVQYRRLVDQIVFRMIPIPDERADVTQDILLKVWEHLGSFRSDCKLSTWIARVTYNHCLNALEKKRVPLYADLHDMGTVDDHPGDDVSPAQWVSDRDFSRKLNHEIDQLPTVMGTVLTLYHFCEMQYDEIATMMSLPEGTVKSHLFRARKLLRERLTGQYEQESL